MFVYSAMPHSIIAYQLYEIMFCGKASTICDACLRLANYNDNYLQYKCSWVKCSVEKSVSHAAGKAQYSHRKFGSIESPSEGQNKSQDNYKSELLVVDLKHQNPNMYSIKLLDGKGPMYMVNQKQLYNLQKSQGDPDSVDQTLDTKLLMYQTVKIQPNRTLHPSHQYGTTSKTQVNNISLN